MAFRKERNRLRIKYSIRRKIYGTADHPRLNVYRSNKDVYLQLIDDVASHTLCSTNSKSITEGSKSEQAKEAGKELGEKALELGIKKVVFDRGGYRYHGRVRAVAEGAREAGLQF